MIIEAIATVAAVQKSELEAETNVSVKVETASSDNNSTSTDTLTLSESLTDQIQISEEAARHAAYAQYEAQIQQAQLDSQLEQQNIDQNAKLANQSHQTATVLPGLNITV